MNDDYSMTFLEHNQFGDRLAELRIKHNISARNFSLSIGQNSHYIEHIENHKTFPTMQIFFYICEFLRITPCQFFDLRASNPAKSNYLIEIVSDIPSDNLELMLILASLLTKK